MANKVMRVGATLSPDQRSLLLKMFQPAFDNVFCRGITLAYDVQPDFVFPKGSLKFVIDSYHRSDDGHDCLIGYLRGGGLVGKRLNRADGKPLHITLSTADGVPPKRAAEIDVRWLRPVPPVELKVKLEMSHATVWTPERRLVAA